MNRIWLQILRFTGLALLQVLVLNNIYFAGIFSPYIYVAFLLLLPLNTPKGISLVLAFFLGLSIDMFTNTVGMHAGASVFLAFSRPYIMNYLVAGNQFDQADPSISVMGLRWFSMYTIILVFLHHIFLFFIEIFRFSAFFETMFTVILSTLLTSLLIVVGFVALTSRTKR